MKKSGSSELAVLRLNSEGEGVAVEDGFTYFVPLALPEEVVQVSVVETYKRYARAKVETRLSDSPHRVKPVCPLFGTCGGCQIMHADMELQLAYKRQKVVDAFTRIGKFSEVAVESCTPSPKPLNYRNKVQLPVRGGKNALRIGFYAHNSHNLVDVERCYIHCSIGESAYATVRTALLNSTLEPYDPQSGSGDLRFVMIRTSRMEKQALVVLVGAIGVSVEVQKTAERLMEENSSIAGVLYLHNNKPGNAVLGGTYSLLCGKEKLEDTLCGVRFQVSPASFFQVNPDQAEQLYKGVLDYLQLSGTEKLLDAYCGVGTLALIAARYVREVVGVEAIPQAIEDAKAAAELNGIENAVFICGDAAKKAAELKEIDAAILNPPRKGCGPALLEAILRLKPEKIAYVSCDPATLARDCRILVDGGYTLIKARPFDMFPQTAHVETVALLTK